MFFTFILKKNIKKCFTSVHNFAPVIYFARNLNNTRGISCSWLSVYNNL